MSAHQYATNICQTEVVVNDPSTSDSSAVTAPLPTYLGTLPLANQNGLLEVPSGYELSPVPDEFDYIPAPTISSVQTETLSGLADADPGTTPGTFGSPTVTEVDGQGLNYQTLNWFSFGDPSTTASQDTSYPQYADGTKVFVNAPSSPTVTAGGSPGTSLEQAPVVADTMAGSSFYDNTCANTTQDCLDYAGVPVITGVQATATQTAAASDSGGTAITITGQGLSEVSGPLEFVDAVAPPAGVPPFSIGTQYTYDNSSDTTITTETVQQNPALVDTFACTDSGCSAQSSSDQLLLYPPGDPVITSVQTASGPPLGGTLVTINGENLGCATSVSFGSNTALSITNSAAILDCGSTTQVQVVAPAGTAGASVPISLSTVESDVTGDNPATSPTDFSYDRANPSVPGSVSFGSVNLASSSTQPVTISNPSSATQPLYPGPAATPAHLTGGNAGDFSIVSDGCSGQTLNPGQSCTIDVGFAPSALGARNARLDIPWNNSTGVDPASATADFSVALDGSGNEPTTTVTTPGATTTVTTPGATTTVTTPGTTTTVTVTKKVLCTVTIRWKWVTVKVHGKKKRERRKVTTRSKGCKTGARKAARPNGKHGSEHRTTPGKARRHRS